MRLSLILALAMSAPPVAAAEREIARRAFGPGELRLLVDGDGLGHLRYAEAGRESAVPCDRLVGAWGLWVGDVDGDGQLDAIDTLRKSAKFDPVIENRLHVYAITDGHCVPMWRGTRLAGRFERIAVDNDRLLALERVQAGRRVAWYRWLGFGYRLEEILWQGRGMPGPRLLAKFDGGKAK